MKYSVLALIGIFIAASALAEPEYVTIAMGIDVARPANEVWKKLGGFCALDEVFETDCTITSGDGSIGSVRSIAGGAAIEVMVAQTDLSYGYTQPQE